MISIKPLGDRAFLAQFESEDEAQTWANELRQQAGFPLLDLVLAYRSVAVFIDPDQIDPAIVDHQLRQLRPKPIGRSKHESRSIQIELPVLYDGEDLPQVAHNLDLTIDEVIAAHHGQNYRVYAIGFFPGFPYAGYLPSCLSGLKRRDEPRLKVPAGSVAIAGRQTGVYPSDLPGGWHLIGRTPLRIVDIDAGRFPIRAGDELRFVPVSSREFEALRGQLLVRSELSSVRP